MIVISKPAYITLLLLTWKERHCSLLFRAPIFPLWNNARDAESNYESNNG